MRLFLLLRRPFAIAAFSLLCATGVMAEPSPPKNLEFKISKATNPGGGGYSGTVSFDRTDVSKTFKVTWKLSDGSTQSGFGVAYPQSGYIAVAYGSEATGVAIYKVFDKGADARWALAGADADVGAYELKRGKVKFDYVYKDGTAGSVRLEPTEVEGVINATYKGAAGNYGGIGITDGDFLAVGATSGTKDFGIAIYHTGKDMEVSGKWIVAGAKEIGTESLEIVSVDGQKMTGDADAAPATPSKTEKDKAMTKPKASKEDEDKELAEKISVDLQKCAAVGEYFMEQVKLDDMDSIVGLMDDLGFDEKFTREDFRKSMEKSRKSFGKLVEFKPDKDKVDFSPAKGGGMNFVLEGDAVYEKQSSRDVLIFFKPQGSDKVALVGYTRKPKK